MFKRMLIIDKDEAEKAASGQPQAIALSVSDSNQEVNMLLCIMSEGAFDNMWLQ